MTEQEIIRGCRRGNEKAFRALVDTYASMIMGVCLRYMKQREKAEDVLQETFILIFKNIRQYNGGGAFGGWLRRIAVTTSLKALRMKHLPVEELNLATEGHDIGEHEPDMEMNSGELMELINSLPEHYRCVFNLYIIEGYSHTEISELLDINESTSRARLLRARSLLKELLTKKNRIYETAEARRIHSK